MYRKWIILALLFTTQACVGESRVKQDEEISAVKDQRQLVTMPAQVREIMRQKMLVNLATLSEVTGYLAEGKLDTAAELMEAKMGRSSGGKYRGTDLAPSKHMPTGMRKIAKGLHNAASEFSTVAKRGDVESSYAALQKVTNACVACHYSYRTR